MLALYQPKDAVRVRAVLATRLMKSNVTVESVVTVRNSDWRLPKERETH